MQSADFKAGVGQKLRIGLALNAKAVKKFSHDEFMQYLTKQAAEKLAKDASSEGHVMIYTDGSGNNKKVGAAAVSPE